MQLVRPSPAKQRLPSQRRLACSSCSPTRRRPGRPRLAWCAQLPLLLSWMHVADTNCCCCASLCLGSLPHNEDWWHHHPCRCRGSGTAWRCCPRPSTPGTCRACRPAASCTSSGMTSPACSCRATKWVRSWCLTEGGRPVLGLWDVLLQHFCLSCSVVSRADKCLAFTREMHPPAHRCASWSSSWPKPRRRGTTA